MNTKAIIGIIIVIGIIVLVVVWLRKTPPSTEPTVAVTPDTTQSVSTSTQPTASSTTSASAPSSSNIINTNTINGMKIDITKEGTGPAITSGQTALVLYTGKLTDGTVFDASSLHGNQPFSFTLGAGQVIKGWDEGVVGMKVGEERTLTIPSDLAYGAAGMPPVIPQNATLIFDVTLVGIQ